MDEWIIPLDRTSILHDAIAFRPNPFDAELFQRSMKERGAIECLDQINWLNNLLIKRSGATGTPYTPISQTSVDSANTYLDGQY